MKRIIIAIILILSICFGVCFTGCGEIAVNPTPDNPQVETPAPTNPSEEPTPSTPSTPSPNEPKPSAPTPSEPTPSEPKSYTVTYDLGALKNDGYIKANGASGAVTILYNGQLPQPECYGYNFLGWALTENGQAISSNVYNFTESKTLYALWEEDNSSGRWYSGEHS